MLRTYPGVAAMVGETLTDIQGMTDGSPEITFKTASGRTFRMYHEQDCCESVYLNDVTGNVSDLIGSPLLKADEVSNTEADDANYESQTWTFYHLATVRGYVTLRWLGESNGYYSESVDFAELT